MLENLNKKIEAYQFPLKNSMLTIYLDGFILSQGEKAIQLKNQLIKNKIYDVKHQLKFLFNKKLAYVEILKN